MTRYAYKSVTVTTPVKFTGPIDTPKLLEAIDQKANEMGEEGWRLVSVTPGSPHGAFFLLVFERPTTEREDVQESPSTHPFPSSIR